MASRFRFSTDTITEHLTGADGRAKAYISKATIFNALKAEGFARQNAPWVDRTGNARAALHANPDISQALSGRWEINVIQGVKYGIWLEVRFAGRYAIIKPTIDSISPGYFRMAADIYTAMF